MNLVNSYIFSTSEDEFAPTDISNLLVWLDASDTSTIETSGSDVTTWSDKSGNNNDLTQSTSGMRPSSGTRTLNGLNTIDFVSANSDTLQRTDALGLTGNPALTIVVVCNADYLSTDDTICYIGDNAGGGGVAISVRVDDGSFRFNNGRQVFSGVTANQTSVLVWQRASGATYQEGALWINGTSKSQTGVANGTNTPNIQNEIFKLATNVYLGSITSKFDGMLCEVVVYNKTLSSTERDALVEYLTDKWT